MKWELDGSLIRDLPNPDIRIMVEMYNNKVYLLAVLPFK